MTPDRLSRSVPAVSESRLDRTVYFKQIVLRVAWTYTAIGLRFGDENREGSRLRCFISGVCR
jgi:hypothetical protein